MKNIEEKTIEHIQNAGMIVMNGYKDLQVEEKGFANFVTNIDLETQKYLIQKLSPLSPDGIFISEESEENDYASKKAKWIIDPIDGTTNMIHGYPHVAISVAYVDEHIEFGVVYNPFSEEIFFAKSGEGAFRNSQPISVSENRTLNQCLIGFGLPYDRSKSHRVFQLAEKVYETCQDLKRKGAASLDLAYVASGRIDGYFEKDLNIWDFAAGAIILKEAGGEISNWKNEALAENIKTCDILATNRLIHDSLLEIISEA